MGGTIWNPCEICSARSNPTIFLSAMKRKILVRSGARMPTSEKPRSLNKQNYAINGLLGLEFGIGDGKVWKIHMKIPEGKKIALQNTYRQQRKVMKGTYQQFPGHPLPSSTILRHHQVCRIKIESALEKVLIVRSFSNGLQPNAVFFWTW